MTIEIEDFSADRRSWFESLNREWISHYFEMEAADERALGDPEGYVLRPGGAIVFAIRRDTGEVVGTCALLMHGDGVGELAKMAVTPSAQGLGAGRRLGEAVIERARSRRVRRLFLESNSRLIPALALYRSLGFVELQREQPSPYERADTYMELLLDS